MNPFLDALGSIGYALDTPGAYLRGALAGSPGTRTSGIDLLKAHGLAWDEGSPYAGLQGFGAEMLTDPLNWIGGGIGGHLLGKAGRSLSHLDEAAPLARRLGELKAGVEDPLDALRQSYRATEGASPTLASSLGHLAGDEGGWLKHGLDLGDRRLNRLADAYGPQYPGGIEKLRDIVGDMDWDSWALRHPNTPPQQWGEPLHALRMGVEGSLAGGSRDQLLERLAGEIPEGSSVLGQGAEAVAFRTPEGGVIRYGPQTSQFASSGSSTARPMIPEMVQPYRSANLGGGMYAEHMPMVTPIRGGRGLEAPEQEALLRLVHSQSPGEFEQLVKTLSPLEATLERPGNVLEGRINALYPGANPWDLHPGNIGVTPEGKMLVLDAGAIGHDPLSPPFPVHGEPEAPLGMRHPDVRAELDRLGTPSMVRESLAQGLASGTMGQGVDLPSLWLKRLALATDRYRLAGMPYAETNPIYSEVVRRLAPHHSVFRD